MDCTDEDGRRRHVLFRELPDKREYPDYYRVIASPIALSIIRKRINSHQYKTVTAFRDDVRLMFINARTYNQKGSWVYVDADEMEKVFDAAYARHVAGSGLPGADMSKNGRMQIISDDEYLTPSDDD